jgi:hypothetical protein
MKHLKQFESYFDKDSPWTEPEGDAILKAFDEGTIEEATKEVEVKPTYRATEDTTETTFRFKIKDKQILVQLLEYPHRDPIIVIKIDGHFTDIPKDSQYRTEILDRCFKSIQ